MSLNGVWLPIITPFKEGKIDYKSYEKLINHYTGTGISGLIPFGTTGEIPTLSEYEFEEMMDKTIEYNKGRLPIYAGVGGNCTANVVKRAKMAEKYKIEGILSVCPYYNKPNQNGIYSHFKNLAEETSLNIIIYNIPYRTGVNVTNDTIHKLAEFKNIVGLKDSCGDIKQTMNLLLNTPENFSVLTGEDLLFYLTLTLGGSGGIMASAHINTEKFVKIYKDIKENNAEEALATWKELYPLIPLLFEEPNPAPIKYCLNSLGLVDSPELRLPLTEISEELKVKIDKVLTVRESVKIAG
ncbi:4-hydroxy-tetrahydrodipicolinate synthase [Anaerocolumna xylanovorans]|uniref:4-hydroxy-tetrahydrodipicolinate synthase n=1 Tax=Anaerocolumna xylanovorans DSM 12503 TaxID=1121345 RepID=A0A1M7XZH2_9FIRM|nr:4-hydroxy-tetrahydrodipicolinate synthase [Anaerocolumna xylanovorans]SHO44467.1 4-hydroxy-tetrahydrodipicolinate synthase [Anaerocolumna xylanovorans DSM 12503]